MDKVETMGHIRCFRIPLYELAELHNTTSEIFFHSPLCRSHATAKKIEHSVLLLSFAPVVPTQ